MSKPRLAPARLRQPEPPAVPFPAFFPGFPSRLSLHAIGFPDFRPSTLNATMTTSPPGDPLPTAGAAASTPGPTGQTRRPAVLPWPADAPRHVHAVRVEFGDCDPAGIVYFPNYFRWLDQATHALCEAAGYSLAEIEARHGWLGFPLVEAGSRFRSPASVGDRLRIETRIKAWQERFFELEYRIHRDNLLLVEGWQTRFIGVVDAGRGGKLTTLVLPGHFREAVAALAGQGAAGA